MSRVGFELSVKDQARAARLMLATIKGDPQRWPNYWTRSLQSRSAASSMLLDESERGATREDKECRGLGSGPCLPRLAKSARGRNLHW